jgi:hypothetical protein
MKKLCICILIYSTIITSWAQNYFDRLYGEDGNLFPDLSDGKAHQLPDSTYLFSYYTSHVALDERIIQINHLDQNGELLKNQQIHEPGFSCFIKAFVPIDTEHFLMLGAKRPSGTSQMEIMLAKFTMNDSGYVPVWWRYYNDGANYLWGSAVISAADSGYYIAGRTRLYHQDTGTFIDEQVLVIRTDSMGEELWRKTYGSPALRERVLGIAPTNDGGFLLAGYSRVPSSNNGQGLIIKIDHSGNQQWLKTYGLNAYWESFHRISLLQDYDRHPGYIDLFYSINTTLDGGFVLTGFARRPDGSSQDAWILKVDSLGCSEPGCIEITSTEEPEGPPGGVDDFRLWPNPASDHVWVEWPRPLPAGRHFIIVFDSAGRQILRRELPAGDSALELEVGGLAPGVYYCTPAIEGQARSTRPFVIVR